MLRIDIQLTSLTEFLTVLNYFHFKNTVTDGGMKVLVLNRLKIEEKNRLKSLNCLNFCKQICFADDLKYASGF